MKKMKLTKKNKRELKAISAVLILFAIVFLWIVQTIGLPIETYIDRGKIKVIERNSKLEESKGSEDQSCNVKDWLWNRSE